MSHSRQTAREESQCTTNSLSLTSSPITPSPHLSLIHHDCKLYCPGAEAVSRLRILRQFLPRGGSHYDGSERETDRPHCMSEYSQRHTPTHLLLVCGTPYCPACSTPNVHCTAEREVCHHCTIPGLLAFIFTTHTTLHTPSPPSSPPTWYPILIRQRRVSLSTMLLLKETKFRTFSRMKNLGR